MRQRAVADIPESVLSDIRHHPPPRPPDGRLKRTKNKKAAVGDKKSPAVRRNKKRLHYTPYINVGSVLNKSSNTYSLIHKP